MALKTTKFDPAAYLKGDKEMAIFLSEAFATGDAAFVADAIGVVARAKGMSVVAKEAHLSRESLYRTLSIEGNPELDTLLRVFGALGLKLVATPIGAAKPARRGSAQKPKAA